jgi:hypothetical protein
MRFSDHFNLRKSQAELDFVDIPLDTDIELFLDPYALSLENSPWFAECNNLVVDFFHLVVNSIAEGDMTRARRLLANLREPNDTHLGMSSGRPRGAGIGDDQAGQIFDRLSKSKAVKTGKLSDLADAELVIPGIGRDKISDITTNVIRAPLIRYTKEQCDLYGAPTRRIASGFCWDSDRAGWINGYAELPTYRDRRILLVPKSAVRYDLAIEHEQYYRHFVLEYLQAEHVEAGTSLVVTLKNGKRKVHKKDLVKEYPLSKDFLFEFSEEHPEVLERYKDSLPQIPEPLTDEQLEIRQPDPREAALTDVIDQLAQIPPGRNAAGRYHNTILGALTAIFSPALVHPVKEREIDQGRKRIDIKFTNRDQTGFFHFISAVHGIRCPYIFFECKNYSDDIENPEIDQLLGRFSDLRGTLGFIVCRSVKDKDLLLRRQRDAVAARRGYILILDDNDILQLLQLRIAGNRAGVDEFLDRKLEELLL